MTNDQSKEARAARRASIPAQLKAAGVVFTSHNDGAHLIIEVAGRGIDYWPGPNHWRLREEPYIGGRGLPALLAKVRSMETPIQPGAIRYEVSSHYPPPIIERPRCDGDHPLVQPCADAKCWNGTPRDRYRQLIAEGFSESAAASISGYHPLISMRLRIVLAWTAAAAVACLAAWAVQ